MNKNKISKLKNPIVIPNSNKTTKKEVGLELVDVDSIWSKRKPWKWYNHAWWWIRHGIWNIVTDLKWQIPNTYGRMRRGWGHADTWCFNCYLANVIHDGLVHLKKYNHGYPATLNPKTGEYDYDVDRWNLVMDDIIYTFACAIDINGHDLIYRHSKTWKDEDYQKDLKFAEEMNEKFYDETDKNDKKYRVMSKEEVERYELGFNYFQEHFYSLWD